jgi:[acyl-carrier-protein] S-malonyltransferase
MIMPKYAALCSGQGSQYAGMGKELYENFDSVKRIYECAGDILGFDVKKLSFDGPEEEMTLTRYAQPLIFTHSMACFEAAKNSLPFPDAVGGHSVGEVAALCAAGTYSLEDGFRVIKARAESMGAIDTPATMIAVMSADVAAIQAACDATPGYVVSVNYNQPSQTVIAGELDATVAAGELLAGQGMRVVRLAVSTAFHTNLMQPAQAAFRAVLETIAFGAPKCDFYSNLTGGKLVVENYADYFTQHMISPVRFVEEMAAMDQDGIDVCIEFGPKKTASTLAKKNVKRFAVGNAEDLASIEKAATLF